ncbi:sporulation integral membrane protein YtvI [Caloranaerobacter azorensis DSM 13643]|uniref:Sporulation integral membrane protein YtvI n=1 Tax=Caloranaerobacter azorensis DSM 13643 TaxID=1121264 RepID=A0A1M5RUI7_9FIRM|nr:AI-2E family transporter [Caloranaerobacter azorensis]SHH29965.1 sporulation integral membrane protein YtvI [Caloranaerobacter azorensis DSM 13643]
MRNLVNFIIYLREIFIVCLLGFIIYFLVNIGNKYVETNKRISISKKKIIKIVTTLLIVLFVYIIGKITKNVTGLFTPFILSIGLSYLLNPMVNSLEKRKVPRALGVLIVYLILIGFILIISFSIFPKLINEFKKLIDVLPNYFNDAYEFFNEIYISYSKNIANLPPGLQGINEVVKSNLDKIQVTLLNSLKNFTNSIMHIFSKAVSFILIPILTFYFLKDKDYFKKKIIMIIPKVYRQDVLYVFREIDVVLGKFIRGQLIVAVFVGVATTIGLLMLGIDFALIIGIIAGIANVIPYFGPIIGIIPALVFALMESPLKALWVIILFTAIQQFESGIISPKIVGESVGLHPVVVIFSLLIGGSYFGIWGLLLAVPITAILKIVINFIINKLIRL